MMKIKIFKLLFFLIVSSFCKVGVGQCLYKLNSDSIIKFYFKDYYKKDMKLDTIELNGNRQIVKSWFIENKYLLYKDSCEIKLIKFGSLSDHEKNFLMLIFASKKSLKYTILGNNSVEEELAIIISYFTEFKKYITEKTKLLVLKYYLDTKLGIIAF